ncbi:AAA family ATPase [Prochlorococcus sp. MIT 0601]|uniref:DNA repair protein RecN n=1 Tax=Prochlorococcus sp. MIT 0601 TaxID=1499498 RepID=UPI00056B33A5|nr:AAA family ATPase [Prochlorococcus sp. MIT 0601]
MLVRLRLENIGLIDSLDLSFQNGFTVFTGETGAGKSIFLDAIDLLLGGLHNSKASKLVKLGSTKSYIEGYFQIDSFAKRWLQKNNIIFKDKEFSISRIWSSNGKNLKSQIKINDQIVTKHQILTLRPYLADLTLQGQQNKIDPLTTYLNWIDQLGSSIIKNAALEVNNNWNNWNKAYCTLQTARNEYNQNKINFEIMMAEFKELQAANITDAQEEIHLQTEEDRLSHAVRLQESIQKLFIFLKESYEESPTALENILFSIKELKVISELDHSLKPHLDKALDVHADLQQLVSDLEHYYLLLESNPDKLNEVQERRSFLKNLKARYNRNLDELVLYRESLDNILNSENSSTNLELLEEKERLAREKRDSSNKKLSKLRKSVAKKLEISLMKYLPSLGLENALFQVGIIPCLPSVQGIDNVNFLFSANPGQPLSLLHEIASGGEMSRFILALKVVLAEQDGASTVIFDEIDSGVSGRVSSAVANLLKHLSDTRQVFCVTHQPLVAALADHHFSISKVSINGSTASKVFELKGFQARKRELAELAGGDFAEATMYAASLLEKKAA